MSEPKKVDDKKVPQPKGESEYDFKKTTEVSKPTTQLLYRRRTKLTKRKGKSTSFISKDFRTTAWKSEERHLMRSRMRSALLPPL